MSGEWLPEFRLDGLCAQTDPELFFPEKGDSSAAAKRVCGRCPVESECLEYAVAHRIDVGVWGGTTASERLDLVKLAA